MRYHVAYPRRYRVVKLGGQYQGRNLPARVRITGRWLANLDTTPDAAHQPALRHQFDSLDLDPDVSNGDDGASSTPLDGQNLKINRRGVAHDFASKRDELKATFGSVGAWPSFIRDSSTNRHCRRHSSVNLLRCLRLGEFSIARRVGLQNNILKVPA